jgi:hypothetical protein
LPPSSILITRHCLCSAIIITVNFVIVFPPLDSTVAMANIYRYSSTFVMKIVQPLNMISRRLLTSFHILKMNLREVN